MARKTSILPAEPLEELVSCPIHLGILEEPLQLTCGHNFCLECLERCLATLPLQDNRFICPVCRSQITIPLEGARGWPRAFALGDIVDYVNRQKQLRHPTSSPSGGASASASNRHAQQQSDDDEEPDDNRYLRLHGGQLGDDVSIGQSRYQRKISIRQKAEQLRKVADKIRLEASGNDKQDKENMISNLKDLLNDLEQQSARPSRSGSITPPRLSGADFPNSAAQGSRISKHYLAATAAAATPVNGHQNAGDSAFTLDSEENELSREHMRVGRFYRIHKHFKVGKQSLFPLEELRHIQRGCVDFNPLVNMLVFAKQPSITDSTVHQQQPCQIVIWDIRSRSLSQFLPSWQPTKHEDASLPLIIRVAYIRLMHDNTILASVVRGVPTTTSSSSSVSFETPVYLYGRVIKFDLTGKVLAQSPIFNCEKPPPSTLISTTTTTTTTTANSPDNQLPLHGFDINPLTKQVYVCCPARCEMVILEGGNLSRTDVQFTFNDPLLHPNFICYSGYHMDEEEDLCWMSSLHDKSVFILNVQSSSVMNFQTSDLFNSEPGEIICTSDGRVLFFDTKQTRIYWIKMTSSSICVQRIELINGDGGGGGDGSNGGTNRSAALTGSPASCIAGGKLLQMQDLPSDQPDGKGFGEVMFLQKNNILIGRPDKMKRRRGSASPSKGFCCFQ